MRRKFITKRDLLPRLLRKGLAPAVAATLLTSALGVAPVYAQGQKTESKAPVAAESADNSDSNSKKDPITTSAVSSDRWIGVVAEAVDDSLRAHLAIPADAGMTVASIVPGAPADRAGLQEYDILLEMDGHPLKDVEGIVSAVKNAGDKGLSVTYLRKGERMTKTIVPEKRPTQAAWSAEPEENQGGAWVAPNVDTDKVRAWIENLRAGKGKDAPLDLRFFGPGMESNESIAMPENLSISIAKKNDEPAAITIKRGDETWQVTEDRLDELPEDIRPFVQRMTGQGSGGVHAFTLKVPEMPAVPGVPEQRWDEMEQRFEDMHNKMEEMLKQMEQLRDQKADAATDGEDA